jgi:hypothetical protein
MPAGRGSCRGPAGRARARQRSRRTAAGRAMRTPGGGSHRDGPRARPALGAGAAGRARARARRRARAGHSSPAPPKGRVTGRPPAKVRAGSDGQVTTRIVWQSSRPLSSTSSSADCSPASRVRSAIATAEVKQAVRGSRPSSASVVRSVSSSEATRESASAWRGTSTRTSSRPSAQSGASSGTRPAPSATTGLLEGSVEAAGGAASAGTAAAARHELVCACLRREPARRLRSGGSGSDPAQARFSAYQDLTQRVRRPCPSLGRGLTAAP